MKKIVLSFTVLFVSLVLCAQPGRPRPEPRGKENPAQMQTRELADRLGLSGDTRTAFIDTYGAFRAEIDSVMLQSRPAGKAETEDDIDKAMQANFEVSEKILEIRIRYYASFKQFLKPSQIRQMYFFENEAGRRMHEGPGRPDGPEDRERHAPDQSRMGPPPER